MNILLEILQLIKRKLVAGEVPSPKVRIKPDDIIYDAENGEVTIINTSNHCWLTTVQDTNSMDPVFDTGHILWLEPIADYSDLIVGDIVVFNSPKGNIIHRIIKITKDAESNRHYKTKGDNCLFSDPYDIKDENILFLYRGEIH